ncbi:MAG: aminoglycoside phosphotransferase family protein [Anaerolineaceae bacterium]|nr:aminoglycoside phosphotransferase family protein [Anaerolineaceae bacterium]
MESLGQPIAQGRTAQIFPWNDGRVVKLYFDFMNPDEAEFEARINAEMHAAGMPAPGGVELVEVEGRKGVLFERVEGPTLLQAMAAKPWRMVYFADMMADLHSQMHGASLAWLRDIRGYFYWAIEHGPEGLPEEQRQQVLEHLRQMPEADSVCHGDFHPENIVLSKRGPVILDWVTACRGRAAADVARTCMMFKVGKPIGAMNPLLEFGRQMFLERYLKTYIRKTGMSMAEVDEWMPVVAAARRRENIQGEEDSLLAMVATGLGRSA